MSVLCQAANGRQCVVRVHGAKNDSDACRKALATLPPAEGWRALVVF